MLQNLVDPTLLQAEAFDIDRVTDRLATTGFACVKGLFAESLLKGLHSELQALDRAMVLTPAGIGRNDSSSPQETVRNDKTYWIEGYTETEREYLAVLEKLRQQVNERLMLGLFDVEAHYAAYHPGAFYQRHLDSFSGARNRLLTLVLYLNRNWQSEDGGQLMIFPEQEQAPAIASVLPEWGHAVVFLSETVPHEVSITHRLRYSIAAWYHCNQPI
jgi:SM-20-related protein